MNIAVDNLTVSKLFNDNKCLPLLPYKNSRTKIAYICRCGNFNYQTLRQFRQTKSCIDCVKKNKYGDRLTPEYKKLSNSYSRLISRTIECGLQNDFVKDILGYTQQEFYTHIMSFENFDYKQSDWVVDHIFPIKAFADHGIVDIQGKCIDLNNLYIIHHLNNLQPLGARENRIKGSNYDPEKFKLYLQKFNLVPPMNPHNLNFE
jgi:hypothetical protein